MNHIHIKTLKLEISLENLFRQYSGILFIILMFCGSVIRGQGVLDPRFSSGIGLSASGMGPVLYSGVTADVKGYELGVAGNFQLDHRTYSGVSISVLKVFKSGLVYNNSLHVFSFTTVDLNYKGQLGKTYLRILDNLMSENVLPAKIPLNTIEATAGIGIRKKVSRLSFSGAIGFGYYRTLSEDFKKLVPCSFIGTRGNNDITLSLRAGISYSLMNKKVIDNSRIPASIDREYSSAF